MSDESKSEPPLGYNPSALSPHELLELVKSWKGQTQGESGMSNEFKYNRPQGRFLKEAVELRAKARLATAEADLLPYIKNPAGIGEHPGHVEEVEKLLREIDSAHSMLDTISRCEVIFNEA